jgi:hypothetical protein
LPVLTCPQIAGFQLSTEVCPQRLQDEHAGLSNVTFIDRMIRDTRARGIHYPIVSFDDKKIDFQYLDDPIDVELISTAHLFMPTGIYWERVLKDNVLGSQGNVIALDHLQKEQTRAELLANPALMEIANKVRDPRHELLISPGDAHEIIEMKGKICALTRRGKLLNGKEGTSQEQAQFSNVSLASVSVTMMGEDEEGHLKQTGHSTFDDDRMLKDNKEVYRCLRNGVRERYRQQRLEVL